jgi:hypothetical protein
MLVRLIYISLVFRKATVNADNFFTFRISEGAKIRPIVGLQTYKHREEFVYIELYTHSDSAHTGPAQCHYQHRGESIIK